MDEKFIFSNQVFKNILQFKILLFLAQEKNHPDNKKNSK
jgi:hypothetical protein